MKKLRSRICTTLSCQLKFQTPLCFIYLATELSSMCDYYTDLAERKTILHLWLTLPFTSFTPHYMRFKHWRILSMDTSCIRSMTTNSSWGSSIFIFLYFRHSFRLQHLCRLSITFSPYCLLTLELPDKRETPLDNNGKSLWSYGLSLRTSRAGYHLRMEVVGPKSFWKHRVCYCSLSL